MGGGEGFSQDPRSIEGKLFLLTHIFIKTSSTTKTEFWTLEVKNDIMKFHKYLKRQCRYVNFLSIHSVLLSFIPATSVY